MSTMTSSNAARRPAARARMRLAANEILGTAAIMAAYFLLRGIRPPDVDGAVTRSLTVIRFEQQIGIFQEVRWQAMFLPHSNLMAIANWVYAWGHYPVMLAIALWLVFKDPVRFRFIRNVLLLSAAVGIVSYWVLPAAPPRLMEIHGYDFGFQDTVHGAQSTVSYFQPGPFVNDYAALPSFHFGWILLSSLAIWSNTGHPFARAGAIAMPAVMWWSVTVTGNHYFFDMVFGGLVVVLAWVTVDTLAKRRTPAAALAEPGP